jgi:putative YhbY family RNA-binding protein
MLTLTVDQRRDLKARAHALNPTVMIGNAGLTEAVLEEIARSLNSHELIKIRVMGDDRAAREAMLEQICEQLDAGAVQHIGKILVVYRPAPQAPAKKAARRKGKPLTKKRLGSRS